MNEIKCPKCKTVFQIDETDYDSIVKQIRDKEFAKEITLREKQFQTEKENALKLLEANLLKNHQEELIKKKLEIASLNNELKTKEEETKNSIEKKYTEKLNQKSLEITTLKNKLELKDKDNKLTLKDVLAEKEKEIISLTNQLELSKNEFLVKEKNIKESYEEKIKSKDEQILYYKDFKARQSTKMIGESLEQHCSNEFNKLRPLFANSYFEKDNDAKSGSKGDFIFRDYDEDGLEIVDRKSVV